MNPKIHIIPILVLSLLLVACNNNQQVKEEGENDIPIQSSGLFLTADQIGYSDIEYGSISKKILSSDVNARGKLVLPVNAKADLVSQYPGLVKAISVHEGNKVSKGQLLATINSPEFISAQQRYLMVKNELIMLEQEYERQKELNKEKISSDKNYQKAQANYNVAMAELTGLGLQLKMAGVDMIALEKGMITAELRIIATIDGYVEDISANPGKYVLHDERMMQVINRDKLLVELNVFEKDILKIRPGQRVSFSLSNLSKDIYEAKIITVGNVVREDNRVVKVLAEFRNEHGRMLPGMFVASEIHTGETEVDALPEEALVRMGDDEWVIFYTIDEERKENGTSFFKVSVKRGFSENQFIEVILQEEIPQMAMIVISGAYFLKTELAKQEE